MSVERGRWAARAAFAGVGLWLALGCSGGLFEHDPDLAVASTDYTKKIPGVSGVPADGNYYLLVGVTVTNRSAHEDYGVTSTEFAVDTVSGASFAASSLSSVIDGACPAAEQISKGASVSCSVVFEVPETDDVTAVRFTTPKGREASADVAPPTCTWCDPDCVDVSSDPDNCGECGVAIDDDQACTAGVRSCTDSADTLCGDSCVNLKNDDENCGACGVRVDPGEVCKQSEPACIDESLTVCDDGCFDLTDDADNCGECGRACPGHGNIWCQSNGTKCEDEIQFVDGICDDICAGIANGYTCTGVVGYYDYSNGIALSCSEPPPSYHNGSPLYAAECDCWYTF